MKDLINSLVPIIVALIGGYFLIRQSKQSTRYLKSDNFLNEDAKSMNEDYIEYNRLKEAFKLNIKLSKLKTLENFRKKNDVDWKTVSNAYGYIKIENDEVKIRIPLFFKILTIASLILFLFGLMFMLIDLLRFRAKEIFIEEFLLLSFGFVYMYPMVNSFLSAHHIIKKMRLSN
ncbi:MAG: hypothetical protein MUC49_15750 [Raineya sp.]|jgi:Sec-independent protein secretion pathway component TatC|nr:hypothetical protein [Raineya sp.]